MARRLASPDYAGKFVRVAVERTDRELRLTIIDSGSGFDWAQYIDFVGERADDAHGRGIAMARLISFDTLAFSERGNQVMVSVALGRTDLHSGSAEKRNAA